MATEAEKKRLNETNQAATAAASNAYQKVTKTIKDVIQKESIKEKANHLLHAWGQFFGVNPFLFPVLVVLLSLTAFGVLEEVITCCIGFFYPAWVSFKAIESPSPEDDKQWLTYWVVYACLHFVELFSDTLLFWIPMYYVLKIILLLWLLLPEFRGAQAIYSTILRPVLTKHQKSVDNLFVRLGSFFEKQGSCVEKQHKKVL